MMMKKNLLQLQWAGRRCSPNKQRNKVLYKLYISHIVYATDFFFKNKNISEKTKTDTKERNSRQNVNVNVRKQREIESNWTFLKGKCIEEF
jgi:hypothetical protein